FRGPGGHSWAAFGVANPANAVGRATALLADLPSRAAPPAPRTTCAVVRLGGGTGLNSIPQEAWLDLDLRSEDPKALAQLDVTVRAALDRALDDENRRRASGTPPLTLEHRPIGDRPSGVTPRTHPLVLAAVAANRVLGRDAELASASTDANVPRAATLAPTGPVLVGAGDIARCDGQGDEATAALLDGIPGTVFTAGNNVYGSDSVAPDFTKCYGPSWGRHKARTRPAVGSHEYFSPGAASYWQYFGAAAGDSGAGYY